LPTSSRVPDAAAAEFEQFRAHSKVVLSKLDSLQAEISTVSWRFTATDNRRAYARLSRGSLERRRARRFNVKSNRMTLSAVRATQFARSGGRRRARPSTSIPGSSIGGGGGSLLTSLRSGGASTVRPSVSLTVDGVAQYLRREVGVRLNPAELGAFLSSLGATQARPNVESGELSACVDTLGAVEERQRRLAEARSLDATRFGLAGGAKRPATSAGKGWSGGGSVAGGSVAQTIVTAGDAWAQEVRSSPCRCACCRLVPASPPSRSQV